MLIVLRHHGTVVTRAGNNHKYITTTTAHSDSAQPNAYSTSTARVRVRVRVRNRAEMLAYTEWL